MVIKAFLGSENLQMQIIILCFPSPLLSLRLYSSFIVHDVPNKKLKKLFPDLKCRSNFIRNTSDLKIENVVPYMRDTTVFECI